jgi:predicted kinase
MENQGAVRKPIMLIIFAGLPGTGKTTLSRMLARRLRAVYLRIDTIEQAIAPTDIMSIGETGYRVGYAVAEDNLRLGRIVIADCVNPIRITRAAWRNAAMRSGVEHVEVLVVCSDEAEHRHRVATRKTDVIGGQLVTWQDVLTREFQSWDQDHVLIDTAGQTVEQTSRHSKRRCLHLIIVLRPFFPERVSQA